MKQVQATYPPVQNISTRLIGSILAAIVVIMALSQLVGFEKMADILMTFWPASLAQAALPLSALIVVVEVFSVPYLLAMRVSPLMRWVSAVCGTLVCLYILVAGVYGVSAPAGVNAGIFGSYIALAAGWWTILLGIIMAGLLVVYTVRSRRRS